ncbi:MAG: hypothetical protein JWR72_264 [Flavisolibacter sp.]|nr:hypothetical protein [Flavisolibacter sp.]
MKCLLHMGAIAAITYDEGIRIYTNEKWHTGE